MEAKVWMMLVSGMLVISCGYGLDSRLFKKMVFPADKWPGYVYKVITDDVNSKGSI
jgi:hypothetical protein